MKGSGYECTKAPQLRKKSHWGIEKLRAYIATVKSRFRPSLTQDASLLLGRHYSHCRSAVDMELQITVRFLESLIRLAQAHARLMFRNSVEIDDAIAIILLMECSVAGCSSFGNGGNTLFKDPTTYVFPDNDVADIEFLFEKANILERYGMLDRLSPKECAIIQENARSNIQNSADCWDQREEQSFLPSQETSSNNGDHSTNDFPQDHYGRQTQQPQQNYPSPDCSWVRDARSRDSHPLVDDARNNGHISQSAKRSPPTISPKQRARRRRRSAD